LPKSVLKGFMIAAEVLVVLQEDFTFLKIFLDKLKFRGKHNPNWNEISLKVLSWTIS